LWHWQPCRAGIEVIDFDQTTITSKLTGDYRVNGASIHLNFIKSDQSQGVY
jgi:hypothetical protein